MQSVNSDYQRLRRLADQLETSFEWPQFRNSFDSFRLELERLLEASPASETLDLANNLINHYTWVDMIEYDSTKNSFTLASIKQQIQFAMEVLE